VSFAAIRWAWEVPVKSKTELLVLLCLCDRADNRKYQCWPSQKSIARRTKLSDRAVRKVLAALEKRGLIQRKAQFRDGARRNDIIRVLVRAPVKSGPTQAGSTDDRDAVPSSQNERRQKNHYQRKTPLPLELAPEPNRPDIDAHNAAARLFDLLRAELGEAGLDWDGPGLTNPVLLARWLGSIPFDVVKDKIVAMTRHWRSVSTDRIWSWAFFEKQMSRLAKDL
jgi:hypothetical protein